jgi:molybdopterin-guanine dinucleotide biosynthesis protein A
VNDTTRPLGPIPGPVLGVVLAGGQSQRMGRDKADVMLAGKSLAALAIERLRPQVDRIALNSNAGPFVWPGVDVVGDTIDGFPGPLAGLLTAMRHAGSCRPACSHVATAAVDTPFFPLDLVARLKSGLVATPGSRLAYAVTAQGPEPVFLFADVALADTLERDLMSGSARRVVDWLRRQPHTEVTFEDPTAFFNINTPDDLATANTRLRS